MGGFSSQFGLFIQLASPMQAFQNATVIISGNCGRTDGKVSCHWNFKGTQHSSHPAEWESNEPSGKVLGVGVEWVLKQQLITAEARRSPGVSDLWLGLSRGKKKKKKMSVPFFPVSRLSLTRALINPCLHYVTGLQLFKTDTLLFRFLLQSESSLDLWGKMQHLRSRWRNLVSPICCFYNFCISDPLFLPWTPQFTDASVVFCFVLRMHSSTVSVLEKMTELAFRPPCVHKQVAMTLHLTDYIELRCG